jgi:protein-disulfide isomerase
VTNARQSKSTREKAAQLRAEAARKAARRRTFMVTGIVVAVLAIAVGAGLIVQQARQTSAQASAPPAGLVNGAIVVGQTDAPVTLTLYEDFQCPVCKQFEELNAKQLKTWIADGTVKVDYRPVAFLDRASTDRYSTRALNAVAAVVDSTSDPAVFVKLHDLLYANQPAEGGAGLTNDQLIQYAVQAGASESAVRPAVQSEKFAAWVSTTTDDASKAGITGTPTVQVNGTTLADFQPQTLADAVKKASAG